MIENFGDVREKCEERARKMNEKLKRKMWGMKETSEKCKKFGWKYGGKIFYEILKEFWEK